MGLALQRHRGFTLIEMMIVVAMLAIFATMALPTYMDRVVRAQVAEGMALTEFAREAVQQSWRRTSRMPADNAAAGLPPAEQIVGNYVSRVDVADGAISITYGQRSNHFLAGKRLTLRPAVVEAYSAVPIAWVCGLAPTPEQMKAKGSNRTNLPAHFLPIDCRA
jgi:type IV pilus assembly protein PilA